MVHLAVPTSVHFHYACGLYTQTLAQMLDSLVRVTRRAAYDHYASILAEARSSVQTGGMTLQAITLSEGSHIPIIFFPPPKPMLACTQKSAPGKSLAEQLRASLIASASLSTISRTV